MVLNSFTNISFWLNQQLPEAGGQSAGKWFVADKVVSLFCTADLDPVRTHHYLEDSVMARISF